MRIIFTDIYCSFKESVIEIVWWSILYLIADKNVDFYYGSEKWCQCHLEI